MRKLKYSVTVLIDTWEALFSGYVFKMWDDYWLNILSVKYENAWVTKGNCRIDNIARGKSIVSPLRITSFSWQSCDDCASRGHGPQILRHCDKVGEDAPSRGSTGPITLRACYCEQVRYEAALSLKVVSLSFCASSWRPNKCSFTSPCVSYGYQLPI